MPFTSGIDRSYASSEPKGAREKERSCRDDNGAEGARDALAERRQTLEGNG